MKKYMITLNDKVYEVEIEEVMEPTGERSEEHTSELQSQ